MPAMPAAPMSSLSYGAMRLRWCGLALRAFVARWGVYLAVTAGVVGAGTVSWEQIIAAATAWLVLPLFYAAAHGAWLLLALPLQVLVGAALVWGARSILWPLHWREAERALPLPRAETLRSDATVVALALMPWILLCACGAAAVLAHRPVWLQPVRALALAALALACLGSLALGVAALQALRGRQRPALPGRRRTHALPQLQLQHPAQHGPHARLVPGARARAVWLRPARWPWWRVLLLVPLWRGPARRTGWTLLGGGVLLLLPSGGLLTLRGGEPWWLAAASLAALLVCTRVNHLARLELAALMQACNTLPLSARRLQRARASLGLWPVLPGVALLCASVALLHAPGLRPGVLASWALGCVGSCVVEVAAEPHEASSKSARWLFSLVLCVCLATEVLA